MLCTENLFAKPFATKSIHQKFRAFLQTFRQAFPNCSFPFAKIHNLKSYLNSFAKVYDVAQLETCWTFQLLQIGKHLSISHDGLHSSSRRHFSVQTV